MALSDRFLERSSGNLNTAESDLLQERAINRKDSEGFAMQKYLRRIMESGDPQIRDMISSLMAAGVPIRDVVKQVQSRMETMTTSPGNLNTAELNQLRESEPGTGMSSEFRELIDRLIAMGVPREEVLKIIQSRMDAMTADPLMSTAEGQFGGSPHGEGPFWRQYNQGGIVSLRRLTRPLGY